MIEKLRQAIASGNKREIDRWGVQVFRETEAMKVRLEKQMAWLEKQLPTRPIEELGTPDERPRPPRYEERLASWDALLKEYQDAIRLLEQAVPLMSPEIRI